MVQDDQEMHVACNVADASDAVWVDVMVSVANRLDVILHVFDNQESLTKHVFVKRFNVHCSHYLHALQGGRASAAEAVQGCFGHG